MTCIELKVKNKTLEAEAKIIRKEERKLKAQSSWERMKQEARASKTHSKFLDIQYHRRWNVRNEQRATFIARGFIEGKKYSEIEQKCNDVHFRKYFINNRVLKMINKYGNEDITLIDLNKWLFS